MLTLWHARDPRRQFIPARCASYKSALIEWIIVRTYDGLLIRPRKFVRRRGGRPAVEGGRAVGFITRGTDTPTRLASVDGARCPRDRHRPTRNRRYESRVEPLLGRPVCCAGSQSPPPGADFRPNRPRSSAGIQMLGQRVRLAATYVPALRDAQLSGRVPGGATVLARPCSRDDPSGERRAAVGGGEGQCRGRIRSARDNGQCPDAEGGHSRRGAGRKARVSYAGECRRSPHPPRNALLAAVPRNRRPTRDSHHQPDHSATNAAAAPSPAPPRRIDASSMPGP